MLSIIQPELNIIKDYSCSHINNPLDEKNSNWVPDGWGSVDWDVVVTEVVISLRTDNLLTYHAIDQG